MQSVHKAAAEAVDFEARVRNSHAASDKFRTNLVDSLKIAADASDWEAEWHQEQEEEHASRHHAQQRLESWQRGETVAGSWESFRDREERLYSEGRLESNKTPPHPKAFEEIVRRVRYAHLMPIPEAPGSPAASLYLSETFPILTSLVDRLLDIPGMTLDTLLQLPMQEHDKLVEANYDVVQSLLLEEGSSSATALPPPSEASEGGEGERRGEVEVFKGQNHLTEDLRDTPLTSPLPPSPPPSETGRPQRQREVSLTATQTLQAVATLCETEEVATWPIIVEAVGSTRDIKYVRYYWALASSASAVEEKRKEHKEDTSLYDAYIKALGQCGDVMAAYNAVEDMKKKGVTPTVNTWNSLMEVYTRNTDAESALKVAQNMRMYASVEPNHETFLLTLQAHRDDATVDVEANARRAMSTMYEMTQVYRLEPTRKHYECLLQALAPVASSSVWYTEIYTQAHQMKHLGIPWSIRVYHTLMWVDACRGDIDKVRELFATYRKRKLPPVDRTYSAVLQGYACAVPPNGVLEPGKFIWARKQREEWERRHDTEPPLDEWRERLFEEGMTVYRTVKEKHDGVLHRTVYALLYMASKLKPEGVRELWKEEGKPIFKQYPRICQMYIDGLLSLADKGDPDALDDAEEVFVEATKEGVRLPRRVYVGMMEAHIKTGREGSVDVALDYMQAMERSGQAISSSATWRIKKLIDEMGPKRDAIRRAKRLMQRRTELSDSLYPTEEGTSPGRQVLATPGEKVNLPGLTPDGFAFPSSPTGLNRDNTLAGESFEDRKAALAQMGYQPMDIENTAQLRSEDKLGKWMTYTASNPHLNFSPDHPSFDKLLLSKQKLPSAGAAAVNPWHRERMAEHPEIYKEDGTVGRDPDFLKTEADSPEAALLAMRASQKPQDLFDKSKPYLDDTYAHTMRHPEAWTGDQEAFMQSWLETSTGKAYVEQAARAKQLRSRVAQMKKQRKDDSGEVKYPDEL